MLKRMVGIDYGFARIGVALSDPNKIIASPLKTIENKKKLDLVIDELIALLKDYQIEEIIVGMPLQMNGRIGFSADEVLLFVKKLQEKSSYIVKTWDERLTTVQVERTMREGKMSRKKRSKVIDAACATLILQSYMDQKANSLLPAYD